MQIPRKSNLSSSDFVNDHLRGNTPVIVTDAMDTWKAKNAWTPDFFVENFGDVETQVFNDLFMLVRIKKLRNYFEKAFGYEGDPKRRPAYVRWYSRLNAEDRVPWADESFAELETDWATPYFLPESDYLLPYCAPNETISPANSPFPARAFFISAKGARTRLHVDPWCTDAILCQFVGEKICLFYEPDQCEYLMDSEGMVDPANPDLDRFPDFHKAKPLYEDTLKPGEILYVPRGWPHQMDTTSDSISLTWNFVHANSWLPFFDYLRENPSASDLETIRYFLHEVPGRKIMPGSEPSLGGATP
jgi:hypothetical protein